MARAPPATAPRNAAGHADLGSRAGAANGRGDRAAGVEGEGEVGQESAGGAPGVVAPGVEVDECGDELAGVLDRDEEVLDGFLADLHRTGRVVEPADHVLVADEHPRRGAGVDDAVTEVGDRVPDGVPEAGVDRGVDGRGLDERGGGPGDRVDGRGELVVRAWALICSGANAGPRTPARAPRTRRRCASGVRTARPRTWPARPRPRTGSARSRQNACWWPRPRGAWRGRPGRRRRRRARRPSSPRGLCRRPPRRRRSDRSRALPCGRRRHGSRPGHRG